VSEQPRLLYIDDIPTPYRLGVHRLVARRWPGPYKLLFLASDEPGRDWDLDFTGLDVEVLPGRQFRPPNQVNPFSIKWNPSIVDTIEAFGPDVVALSGYIHPPIIRAARWCLTHRVPYAVVCETSRLSTSCSGWRWGTRRALLGWVVRNMAFGLPVGREAAEYLRRFGPTVAPMHHFPNTPDTSAIVAEADRVQSEGRECFLRATFGIEPDAPIVLFAGRLIEAKRPMDALAAFEQLGEPGQKAVFVVVGDGPLRPALANRARASKVVFTGWLRDRIQMAGLMAIARVFVLPSAHEPWGAVVNEALAAGTPVVASDRVTSAIEMVVPGVNGFLYPAGDVDALSECIRTLLALDEPGRGRMKAAARATATAYGHEFAAGNLVEGALAAIGQPDDARKDAGKGLGRNRISDRTGPWTKLRSCFCNLYHGRADSEACDGQRRHPRPLRLDSDSGEAVAGILPSNSKLNRMSGL
jgi:glycosyltransferase involved in cell wall biosynthesis